MSIDIAADLSKHNLETSLFQWDGIWIKYRHHVSCVYVTDLVGNSRDIRGMLRARIFPSFYCFSDAYQDFSRWSK